VREKRKLKTNAMMIPDSTIGRTNTARSAFLARIREVRPMARSRAMTLTRITVTTATPIVKPYAPRMAGSLKRTA